MGDSVYYGNGGLQQQMLCKSVVGTRRRGGRSPPLPSWKFYKNPFYDGLAAAVVAAASAAAAAAKEAEHEDDSRNEEDRGDECVKKQAGAPATLVRRSSATTFASPVRRTPLAMATKAAQPQDNVENVKGKPSRAFHQGSKGHYSTVTASRPFATAIRRSPAAMAGGASLVFDKDTTYRSAAMQVAYEKEAIDLGLVVCRVPRDSTAMPDKSLAGAREESCEETVPNAEDASVALSYPISLPGTCQDAESPNSPRSHLQPQPPSSTSDSPCSSKRTKASRVSTRGPQLNKSPQPTHSISPPLKTITLMRPEAGGEGARLRSCVLKSASSSQCSPLGRDVMEQLASPIDGEIITSPRDYLKALNRSCGPEGKQMEGSPIIPVLSEELRRALTRVQELEHSQISARKEVDGLLKRFADERTLLRTKEQEKIQAAVFSIEEELNKERKVRRRAESENRKLSRNLAEASKAVVKAEKELDKEREARQLMEDVCDELAKEIGEDKAEFEQLKREHSKLSEEIEEEHRTLQMTEAWREERVQMKFSEAKFELEERCMALDKLTMELKMYLNSRLRQGAEVSYEGEGENLSAAAEKLKTETSWSMLLLENSNTYAPHSQDDEFSSDDIYSLRLSRDNIRGQSESGAYSNEGTRDRAKWVVDSSTYTVSESRQISASDDSAGDESMHKMNVYADMHNICKQPMPRWRRNEESMTGLPSGSNGPTNFDNRGWGEGANSDEENEAESNGAGSTWGNVGEDLYQNLDESGWSVVDAGDREAWRHDVDASGTASEDQGSLESFSPESKWRGYKHGMTGLDEGRHQDHRVHGVQRDYHDAANITPVTREQPLFPGARHNAEHENELSSAGSSPVYKLKANSQDFSRQEGNWPVVLSHRSAFPGRRVLVESYASQGRKDLVEWVKQPYRSNMLQTKLDRINGLHLQSRQLKGLRLR